MKKYVLMVILSIMPFMELMATPTDANITSTIGWYWGGQDSKGAIWYQGAVDLKNIKTGKTTTLLPAQTNQADNPSAGNSTLVAGDYEINAAYYRCAYIGCPRGEKSTDHPKQPCHFLKYSFEEGKSYEINFYWLNNQEHCEVQEKAR